MADILDASLQITLYQNSSDNDVVPKYLGKSKWDLKFNHVYLKSNCTLKKPTIILHLNDKYCPDWAKYNYAYIPQFYRYYYIDNITFLQGNNVQLDLSCDVLMSFYDDYIDKKQYITRVQDKSLWDWSLPDSDFNVECLEMTDLREFGSDIIENNNEFVITTIG